MLFTFNDVVTCDIHDFDNGTFIENGTILHDTNMSAEEWTALLNGELVKWEHFGENVYVSMHE